MDSPYYIVLIVRVNDWFHACFGRDRYCLRHVLIGFFSAGIASLLRSLPKRYAARRQRKTFLDTIC